MPALSVVIPTHDTRELTLACVVSVEAAVEAAAADLSDTEILVVDDGSGDGTAEALAARHPRIAVMRLSPAAGFTRAANLGMARSRGEVLLLLNSDTEVAPGALARLRDAFAREPRLGAAGARLHYPDGRAQWSGGGEPGLLWLFALASGLPPLLARLPGYRRAKPAGAPAGRVAWVAGAALAVRRRAWEEAGGFDEGFRFYAQDLDLCLRLGAAGWRIELLPEVRVLHHHGATIGRDPETRHRQHAGLLWTDLLRWARRHRGERWAARAALALCAGAALRLLGRGAAAPFVPGARRAAWRQETAALRRAARALAAARRLPG